MRLFQPAAAFGSSSIEGPAISDDESNAVLMPLRVIDVRKTIENRKAGGIHFTRNDTWHVISHTWSAEVRAFSSIVGERQKKSCLAAISGEVLENRQDIASYEALFQSAGFHCDLAYQKLIELLMILETKQVTWVWFDAVCINQSDKEEKDREIEHMGNYYQKSKGCYVLQHGICRGFELILPSLEEEIASVDASNSECADRGSRIPRWFTRAWTLQEWVLSPWLTFITDLSLERCLCTIAALMLFDRARSGCFCCMYETTISEFLLGECLLQHADVHVSRCENCSNLLVQRGKPLCLLAPHFTEVPGKSHWYFVDDLGYSFLLRLKFQIAKAMAFEKELMAETEFELTKRIGINRSIQRFPSASGNVARNLQLVVWEISQRDCSNAEDRVLWVLKLLGVENAFQVRTGKSLNAQLLQLARRLGDKRSTEYERKLLVYLTLVDGFGNAMPDMSWMPHFEIQEGSWQEGARILGPTYCRVDVNYNDLEPELTYYELSDRGMLQIEGDVCTGHLHMCNDGCWEENNIAQCTLGGDRPVSRRMLLTVQGQELVVYAHMEIAHHKICIIEHQAGQLVIWGAFEANGRDSLWHLIIPEGDERPLHKIGYIRTDLDFESHSSQKTHCCIGGLGPDASRKLLLNVEDASGSAASSPA
ncbi:hypothetical protein GOP47_0008370 [Adiantum capillus-veneris]|uniref:Heterokaryon incompatibility domain-containing protein n=1 Tax=Adiantum capillus-veneris TaxID=13818 RepID=A0A9D4UY59_ADICA|nr:hypothetical protein GOP47_0008370 [Adiantum capillus-veneris]